jgi:hypothetical protein
VYEVPFCSPVTVAVVAPVVETRMPPGLLATVYPVMGLPPAVSGTVHDTIASPAPGVANTFVGASGTVGTVMPGEAVEDGPVPTAFEAVTVNV